ncbi:MAG: AAA family ATPase [Pirellulaceae bacterium]
MYEQIFQLKKQPFTVSPKTDHYFPSEAMQTALAQCKMTIDRASGPAVCIGAPGLGKTLLLEMLVEDYREEFQLARIPCSKMSKRVDLLQSILFALDQPYRDMTESELRLVLTDYLKPHAECPNGVLILVDDSHWLSSGLLDELRMWSAISHGGEHRCHLVLTGNRHFEEALADPQNDSLNQRIAARAFLSPMTSAETREYVQVHLRRAGGGNRQFFTDSALEQIHGLTQGVPRLVNQLCDHSLVLCAMNGLSIVDDKTLRNAWSEIEQFPAFWNSAATVESSDRSTPDDSWSVIEYGSLETEEAPQEPAKPEPTRKHSAIDQLSIQLTHVEEAQLEPAEAESTHSEWDEHVDVARETMPILDSHSTQSTHRKTTSCNGCGECHECENNTQETDMGSEEEAVAELPPTTYPIPHVPDEDHEPSPEPIASTPSPAPIPTRAATNPFEEAFSDELEISNRVAAISTEFNQLASKLDRSELDEQFILSRAKDLPYQFDTSMFADIAASISTSDSGDIVPTYRASNLEDYIASLEKSAEVVSSVGGSARPEKLRVHSENQHVPTSPKEQTKAHDDRDIIVSDSRNSDASSRSKQVQESSGGSDNEIGKGNALRMDYRQLFEQLRKAQS